MLALRTLALCGACFCIAVFLSGCWERKTTYSYLMTHPEDLQAVYNQCVEEATSPALSCETILRAQTDFSALTNQREQGPERFGARILQEEENSVFLKIKYEMALQAYQSVEKSKSTPEALKKMQIEVDKDLAAYKASMENVRTLLAVIVATSMV